MKRIPKVAYTLEFKLEALRRVRGGEAVRKVAREIGIPEQSVRNWVKAQAAGKLGGVEGGKPITLEQMELSRLRAENARLKMEMEILKKAAVGSTIQCNTFVLMPNFREGGTYGSNGTPRSFRFPEVGALATVEGRRIA